MRYRSIQGRQLSFVEGLFDQESQLTVEELLEKLNVDKMQFMLWLKDFRFRKEIQNRITWSNTLGQILLAKYTIVAASRLIALTDSKNSEVARRACLDIISMNQTSTKRSIIKHIKQVNKRKGENKTPDIDISQEKAGKLLELLAEMN